MSILWKRSSHIELRDGNIFTLLKPSKQQQDNFRQICRGIAIACYAEARYLRLTIDKDLISEEKLLYLYFIQFTLGYGSLAFILSHPTSHSAMNHCVLEQGIGEGILSIFAHIVLIWADLYELMQDNQGSSQSGVEVLKIGKWTCSIYEQPKQH